MDIAYDHIQEEAFRKEQEEAKANEAAPSTAQPSNSLNNDLQDAYKAFSSSPWGSRIGGFFGNVVKQGESVYTQASKELAEVGEDATKGFTGLRESFISHTRSLSLNTTVGATAPREGEDNQTTPTKAEGSTNDKEAQESEDMLSRLRSEAAKRLKDLQRAEDAADEALLKFGSNVRNYLKDAITVAPPEDSTQSSTILFESKDSQGKRVIHASRFDAQLHVIHTSTESFMADPSGEDYAPWAKDFDVEKKTDDISGDLAKYPELRVTMEKLVPDQIPYADFWKRYYFLKHGIETAEARRKELLKAASTEDEVAWDDDSDDETAPQKTETDAKPASTASSTTIHRPTQGHLKPTESRKSNDEKSQADSEASYDVVGATSGKTSQAPNSPKETKGADDSDDDWE